MGTGQISGSSMATVAAASSSSPAGAVRWGTTTIPTSDVIMPLAMIRWISP